MPPLPPVDMIRDALLFTVLPAFVVTAAVLALTRKAGGDRAAKCCSGLALAAGLLAANLLHGSLPFVPRARGWEWLFGAVLAALVVEMDARLLARPIVGWLLRGATSILAAWLLVPADLAVEKPWVFAAFASLVLANWVVLVFAAGRPPGGTVPASLALVALGGAVVLIHGHSARFTDAATLFAAALGGSALIGWWFRIDTGGAMPAVAVFLPGIMLAGYTETYSDVPWTSFALVALAPLILALTLVGPLTWMRTQYLQLLRCCLLLALAVAAVTLAMRAESLEF